MLPEPRGHVVIFPLIEAWGHIRPFCGIAARAVQTKPFYITFLTAHNLYDRTVSEIERHLKTDPDNLRKLIRVVAFPMFTGERMDYVGMMEHTLKAFASAMESLVDEAPIPYAQTDLDPKAIPSPTAVLLDTFFDRSIDPIRNIGKAKDQEIKIIGCSPGFASSYFHVWGPTRLGGRGDMRPKILEEVQKSGRPYVDVAEEIMFSIDGRLLNTPGLPPMYDHEYYPQEMIFPPMTGAFWVSMQTSKEKSDALLLTTSELYEPEGLAGIRDWFGETSRPVYAVGPLFPPVNKEKNVPEDYSPDFAKVQTFLDQTFEKYGEHSLVYISFGSLFWSKEPEKIFTFLDVMIEKKIPFIMSYGSPFASIPDAIAKKVETFGLGLLTKWSPQQTILSHSVTGWFVTHCGHNSVMEAIAVGIPLICWPYHADQAPAAAHLTANLDVGYELFEVRTGDRGLKPIRRLGDKTPRGTLDALREEAADVLDKAFGEDGTKKRVNMSVLQEKVMGSWDEGGSSRRDLKAFVDAYIV